MVRKREECTSNDGLETESVERSGDLIYVLGGQYEHGITRGRHSVTGAVLVVVTC